MTAITTVRFPVEMPVAKRGEHWYARAGEREIRLSNLDKIYWPDDGYTKGDLLNYYFNISPVMLPHLEERPLTLKRMPDGINGPHFYEKNAQRHTPEWMPTIPVWSPDVGRTINFLTVCDVAHMLYVVNLGAIEFHPLHGRGGDQAFPSYCFFDLDPFEPAGWDEVARVGYLIKAVLDRLGVTGYPKTSGATGMQIMIPLDGRLDYDHVRGFVGTICDVIHGTAPEITTLEWETRKRAGKVFLDVNMNRRGANIAAAYSLRPEPRATASAPLRWEELDRVHPSRFTIETMFERVAEVGDPFEPVARGDGHDLRPLIAELGAKPRRAREIRP